MSIDVIGANCIFAMFKTVSSVCNNVSFDYTLSQSD